MVSNELPQPAYSRAHAKHDPNPRRLRLSRTLRGAVRLLFSMPVPDNDMTTGPPSHTCLNSKNQWEIFTRFGNYSPDWMPSIPSATVSRGDASAGRSERCDVGAYAGNPWQQGGSLRSACWKRRWQGVTRTHGLRAISAKVCCCRPLHLAFPSTAGGRKENHGTARSDPGHLSWHHHSS